MPIRIRMIGGNMLLLLLLLLLLHTEKNFLATFQPGTLKEHSGQKWPREYRELRSIKFIQVLTEKVSSLLVVPQIQDCSNVGIAQPGSLLLG